MDSIDNSIKATGVVTLQLFGQDGSLLKEHVVKNLVVTSGLGHIAARMSNTGTPTQMTHMALGSSNTSPAAGDTALGAQLGSRAGLGVAGGTPSGASVAYTATFGAGVATGAVVEAGIFNGSTGGTMLCRTVFPVINKGASDSLVVNWTVTISQP